MSEFDYDDLLKKVQKSTFKKVEGERFKVPKADVFFEGNTTVIKNFDKIANTINREPEQLLKFLLGNLGTAGEIVGGRAVFQGKLLPKNIQDKLEEYIDIYVICSECNRPDTHMVKKGRTLLIRCDACGAFHAVGSIKKHASAPKTVDETLKEGNVYELTIKDIGKKGDGVAFMGKYIVYVPGAVKGSTVKVKIDKISGTMAFGRLAES